MKNLIIIFCVFLSFFSVSVMALEDIASGAKSAILIDANIGAVLYEKNADEKLPPASMTKIMSMLLIMESVDNGRLSLDDEVTISKISADMGGSQIFLQEGEIYKVSELLKGIAIASGNDAVVAMAEKIGGTVEEFVQQMNDKAKELNLQNTNFINPHGLDSDEHYSSARDMAIIAKELLKHDKILEYTSIYEEYLNKNDGSKTWLVNTNKLVRFYNGADGLKTGFTKNAGYCLTATAKKNDLRLISVVMGEETTNSRSEDTIKMLNYGFNTFKNHLILDKNTSLGKIKVEKGNIDNVDVYLKNDATQLLKITDSADNYSFNLTFNKITAPIKAGNVIGQVELINNEGDVIDKLDLTVHVDISKANLWNYLRKNFKIALGGKLKI